MIRGEVINVSSSVPGVVWIKTESTKWKVGEPVLIKHDRSTRTLPQNALYWKFLRWAIDTELKHHGHYVPLLLHENLKAHFLDEQEGTSEMDIVDFSEWIEKTKRLFYELFGLDSEAFFALNPMNEKEAL